MVLFSGVFFAAFAEGAENGEKKSGVAAKNSILDKQNGNSKGTSIIGNDKKKDEPNYIGRLLYSVLLILILGSIGIYLSKKFGPGLKTLRGQNMTIKESLHIGSGRSVHLLDVAGKTFLIGSTAENINLLGDVTQSFAEKLNEISRENDNAV